jgi:23S rRNA-/tRNA-specific pseudouridylate synthase
MRHYHAATLLFISKASSLRLTSTRLFCSTRPTIEYLQSESSFLPRVVVKSPPSTQPIWYHDFDELARKPLGERPSLFCNDDAVEFTKPPLELSGGVDRFSSKQVDLSHMEALCREAVKVVYSDSDMIVLDKQSGILSVNNMHPSV